MRINHVELYFPILNRLGFTPFIRFAFSAYCRMLGWNNLADKWKEEAEEEWNETEKVLNRLVELACKPADLQEAMKTMEYVIAGALEKPEHVNAYNTYQVKNFDRYQIAAFLEPMKRQYREEHCEQDLQRDYDAGRRRAEEIISE